MASGMSKVIPFCPDAARMVMASLGLIPKVALMVRWPGLDPLRYKPLQGSANWMCSKSVALMKSTAWCSSRSSACFLGVCLSFKVAFLSRLLGSGLATLGLL